MTLVYALLISGALCAAGFAGEFMLRLFRRSERGVWLLILVVSSAGPIAMVRWAQHEPAEFEYQRLSLPSSFVAERDEQSIAEDSRQGGATPINPAVTPSYPTSAPRNETARWLPNQLIAQAWIVLSAAAMIMIAAGSLTVTRRARRWTIDQLHGIRVRVSDDVGPAVIGMLRPHIVVPRWLLSKSAAVQRAAVTHELEHVRGRDPALWRFGLVLLALTPWNPIVWWQLRRLRFAIEKDCDQRVLRRGIDRTEYGRALLDIAQSQTAPPFGAVALAERVSQLEQRIRAMLSRPRGYGHRAVWAALAGVAMVGCIAIAAEVRPPGAGDPATLRWPPTQDRSTFWAIAKAAAKERYPALFAGHLARTVLINVDVLYNGTVLATSTQEFPLGPLSWLEENHGKLDAQAFNRVITWENEGVTLVPQGGLHFQGWFGPQRSNGLYVEDHVLKWAPDPARNTVTAERLVSAKYPEYFKSYTAGNNEFRIVKTLTVLFDDRGTIASEKWGTDDASDAGEGAILSHFRAIGLEPSSLAHWGDFTNFEWNLRAYKHVPPLRVFYAWRRRTRDPVFNEALLRRVESSAQRGMPTWESSNQNAIRLSKFYFPEVWAHGTTSADEMIWFLLDQSGTVIDHGYGHHANSAALQHSPERHPGIRIGDHLNVGVDTMNGRTVRASFEWLAADSAPP